MSVKMHPSCSSMAGVTLMYEQATVQTKVCYRLT